MKTPEQLKGAIRNLAKQQNLQAQEVLQIFLFERFIERLSLSPYRENFAYHNIFSVLRSSFSEKFRYSLRLFTYVLCSPEITIKSGSP